MKLAEFNLDAMDGADKAWDAIHEWLDRYGIEISATDECELHNEIHHILKNVEVKQNV